jgi:hypothetical protein
MRFAASLTYSRMLRRPRKETAMTKYKRAAEHDMRISNGDDFAGDAWQDTKTGRITYTDIGEQPANIERPDYSNPYPHDPDLDWY